MLHSDDARNSLNSKQTSLQKRIELQFATAQYKQSYFGSNNQKNYSEMQEAPLDTVVFLFVQAPNPPTPLLIS